MGYTTTARVGTTVILTAGPSLIQMYQRVKGCKLGIDSPIRITIPSPTKTRQDIASTVMGIITIRRQSQHRLIATQVVMHVKLQMVMLQAVEDLMILLKRYKS